MALDWQRDRTRSARLNAARAERDETAFADAIVARYNAPSKAELRQLAARAVADWSRRQMNRSPHPHGPPMTIADMRENGVRSLWVECKACRREVSVVADMIPSDVEVPKAGRFFRCSACGSKDILTRPDWSSQFPKAPGSTWRG